MDGKNGRRTLTVVEVAKALGVSRDTAYGACRDGTIPCIKLGRRVVVPAEALERVLAGAGTPGK